ncbi:competence protein ComQ [Paenibacillus cellulosilyticus]|uniref:Competence protein ComQ n=1 Tax=Paenibacillus cellulosilyticus TaxID=375489 RepID=A0A2V2YH32_9BACL|nr:polyprenyl synthetase family protein [Paenibacillus cellulosilyticus]PWV92105.1 competence protein ComQ [Paenibacillus cellulosilyticus]QKS44215.1 polyprenyl synthetase family protein [Paenibacillus cellulosilyticus]
MSTVLQSAAELMRVCTAKVFHDEELRSLVDQFIEYKQTEGGVFGKFASLHCSMFGGDDQLSAAAAAAVELMILSLDIYDDLQDQDNELVPWSAVPPSLALNAAIGLQALSVDILMELSIATNRKMAAVNALNKGILGAVNGQHADLLNDAMTEDECLAMIENKSGALVAAACLVGTALVTDDYHEIIRSYGKAIGVSAQINNDVEGVQRWSTRNDLIARKQTLPIQFVLEQQTEEAAVIRSYYDGNITRDELLINKSSIMDYIQGCGCIEYALIIGRLKQYEAMNAIAELPVSDEWREQLRTFL